jgi:23S rRNA pseudouridine2605 synthase
VKDGPGSGTPGPRLPAAVGRSPGGPSRAPDTKPQRQRSKRPEGDAASRYIERQKGLLVKDTPDRDPAFVQEWGTGTHPAFATAPQSTKLTVYLARCGVGSKEQAKRLVSRGHVQVNGLPVLMNCVLRPEDRVTVDGMLVRLTEPRIWLYHKPRHVMDTMQPGSNQSSAQDRAQLIKAQRRLGLPPHVIPISGLSFNNEGLQVLTNDSHLAQQIAMSPIRQTFIVHIRKMIPPNLIESIRRGANIDGIQYPGLALRIRYQKKYRSSLEIDVHENHRQKDVRLLLKAIHCEIKKVKRIQYGPFSVKGIKKGDCIELPVPEDWGKYLNPMWRLFASGQFVDVNKWRQREQRAHKRPDGPSSRAPPRRSRGHRQLAARN